MTIHTTLPKFLVSLSRSQWASIDTSSVLLLAVPSPLDRVLYAGQVHIYFLGNSDMLFGKSLPISFVAAHHPDHRGVISALGTNDQGVTHARESSTPLTPVQILCKYHIT